jgi:gas vesicle protein
MENKSRVILIGALLGAIIGLIAALLVTRRAENNDRETAITAGEGIKIGALVLGLLRAIASLGDD